MRSIAAALFVAMSIASCATPSATPSASPLASASASSDATEIAVGPLPPGTYTDSDFSPRIEVTVTGSGWEAFHREARFWDVARLSDNGLTVLFFQQPTIVYGPPDGASPSSAPEAVDLLRQNQSLTVSEAEPIEIGGREGLQVDVTAAEEDTQVFAGEQPLLGIGPTEDFALNLIQVDEGLLVIGFLSPKGQMEQTAALLQPMVDSIRFREGQN